MDDTILSQKVLNSIEDIQQAIFAVFKPLGWTSFDVVKYLKGKYKIKKIGHGGTLDPLASGVVLIFTGKNTKRISEFQKKSKTYIAKIVFGCTTKSLDGEFFPDRFVDTSDIDIEKIKSVIQDKFIGEIEQIPPIFSALKHKGRPLYKIARNKDNLNSDEIKTLMEKKKRIVNILEFKINSSHCISIKDLPFNSHLLVKNGEDILNKNNEERQAFYNTNSGIKLLEVEVIIKCTSGTYIRSIARDLPLELGCQGYLTFLERIEEYGYNLNNL